MRTGPETLPDRPAAERSFISMTSKLAFGVEPSKRRYRLRLARYQGLVDAVAAFLSEPRQARDDPPDPLRLLDIGAGDGRTLRYLETAGLADDIQFHGLDISPTRRKHLYQPDRWDYRLHDIENGLPYESASFDIAVCEQVLEHLAQPEPVLREIARVLRPGGMAILGVPSFPPPLALFRRQVIARIDRLTRRRSDHPQTFSRRSFVKLIRRTDAFDVQAINGFRIMSGGPLAPLEDYHWWYQFNRRLATSCPDLAVEIQVIARRRLANES